MKKRGPPREGRAMMREYDPAELRARCPGLPAVASAYVKAHDARLLRLV